MQKLVSAITLYFMHRFTHNLNLGWVSIWMTLTYILPTVPNRNEWKLCQFLTCCKLHAHNYTCIPIFLGRWGTLDPTGYWSACFSQNGCWWPFWMTENPLSIAFLTISDQYTTLMIFFSENGCRQPFWMTENRFWSHFSPFQITTQLRFFSQNGCRRPFWMTENHFQMYFSPF